MGGCNITTNRACIPCASATFKLLSDNSTCQPCTASCGPGFQLVGTCTATTNPMCMTCSNGTYKTVSDNSSCQPCTSSCGPGFQLKGTCIPIANPTCAFCATGTFKIGSDTSSCIPCSRTCDAGYAQNANCTLTTDRLCASNCAAGKFNNGASLFCKNCSSSCPLGYGTAGGCTAVSDFICLDCFLGVSYNSGNSISCQSCSSTCSAGTGQNAVCTISSDRQCSPCIGNFYNTGDFLFCQSCNTNRMYVVEVNSGGVNCLAKKLDGVTCISSGECVNSSCKLNCCNIMNGQSSGCLSCNNAGSCSVCMYTHYISANNCLAKFSTGSPCTANTQCISNGCQLFCCNATSFIGCTTCNINGDCDRCGAGFYVSNSICIPLKATGLACNDNTHCRSASCPVAQPQVCCANRFCLSCTSAGLCLSCNTSVSYFDSVAQSCFQTLPGGASCIASTMCQSFVCNLNRLKCCSTTVTGCIACNDVNSPDQCTQCTADLYTNYDISSNTCIKRLDSGLSPCYNDLDCKSMRCGPLNQVCCNANISYGCTYCSTNQFPGVPLGTCLQCASLYYLSFGNCFLKIDMFAPCISNSNVPESCKSEGSCVNNFCCPVGCTTCPTKANGVCQVCKVNYYNLNNNTCLPKFILGSSCYSNEVCIDGSCKSNFCCGTNGNSPGCTACSPSGECSACGNQYVLNNGKCTGTLGIGQLCSTSSLCVSTDCRGVNSTSQRCCTGHGIQHVGCIACNEGGDCFACATNYFLNGKDCILTVVVPAPIDWLPYQIGGAVAFVVIALVGWLIFNRSDWNKNHKTHHVFISYRVASDADIAQKLYYELKERFVSWDKTTCLKIEIFWDKKGIFTSENWKEKFVKCLEHSCLFVPIISEAGIGQLKTSFINFLGTISNLPCICPCECSCATKCADGKCTQCTEGKCTNQPANDAYIAASEQNTLWISNGKKWVQHKEFQKQIKNPKVPQIIILKQKISTDPLFEDNFLLELEIAIQLRKKKRITIFPLWVGGSVRSFTKYGMKAYQLSARTEPLKKFDMTENAATMFSKKEYRTKNKIPIQNTIQEYLSINGLFLRCLNSNVCPDKCTCDVECASKCADQCTNKEHTCNECKTCAIERGSSKQSTNGLKPHTCNTCYETADNPNVRVKNHPQGHLCSNGSHACIYSEIAKQHKCTYECSDNNCLGQCTTKCAKQCTHKIEHTCIDTDCISRGKIGLCTNAKHKCTYSCTVKCADLCTEHTSHTCIKKCSEDKTCRNYKHRCTHPMAAMMAFPYAAGSFIDMHITDQIIHTLVSSDNNNINWASVKDKYWTSNVSSKKKEPPKKENLIQSEHHKHTQIVESGTRICMRAGLFETPPSLKNTQATYFDLSTSVNDNLYLQSSSHYVEIPRNHAPDRVSDNSAETAALSLVPAVVEAVFPDEMRASAIAVRSMMMKVLNTDDKFKNLDEQAKITKCDEYYSQIELDAIDYNTDQMAKYNEKMMTQLEKTYKKYLRIDISTSAKALKSQYDLGKMDLLPIDTFRRSGRKLLTYAALVGRDNFNLTSLENLHSQGGFKSHNETSDIDAGHENTCAYDDNSHQQRKQSHSKAIVQNLSDENNSLPHMVPSSINDESPYIEVFSQDGFWDLANNNADVLA